jgi:predicted ATP-grasp superfamily ATP-dependent carboligase
MNLLITNSQEFQAYLIAHCLQAEAGRIVITEGGESVVTTGFRGMLPYSRLVNARYRVPHFADDWLAGRLRDDNSEAEEAYVRRIEEICALEQIDTIFPSLDPEVYLFAKNKARLLAKGVLAVVPEPEVLRVPMDKALTIEAAVRVGFPCPRTYFPVSDDDVDRVAVESTPPWVVKPRFTAHGTRMVYVAEREQLRAACTPMSGSQQWPLIQEYVPGGLLQMYNLLVGRDSEILSILSPKCVRAFRVDYRVSHRTTISSSTGPFLAEVRALVRDLGLWGPYTIQTKIDPRDGLPKLLEINARFGNNLWRRTVLGVNEPLAFLRLVQGRTPTGQMTFPDGVIQLEPANDFLYLCRQLVASVPGVARALQGQGRGRASEFTDVNPQGVFETLRVYWHEYVNARPKVFKPDTGDLFVDPWPCVRSFGHSIGREVRIRSDRVRNRRRRSP